MWPRKEFGGGLLWIVSWTYRFYRGWEFHGCLKECKLLYELCSLELKIFNSSDGIKGLGIHLVQKQNRNLESKTVFSGDQRLSVASRRTIFSGRLEGLKTVTMEISLLETDAVKYGIFPQDADSQFLPKVRTFLPEYTASVYENTNLHNL
jgi:hypothetical protein